PSASQVLYVIRAPWFYGDASKAYWSSEPQGPSQNTLSIFAANAWGRRAEPNRIKHMIDAWGFAALAHELCHVAWHRRTSWGNGYLNALTLMAAAAAGTGMNETLSLSKFINEYALARAQSYGILAKKQQLATDRLFWRLLLGCGAANKLIEGLTETEVTLLFAPPCTEAAIQSRLNFANLHAIAVTVAGNA
ncbi:MAG: hypothetical protein PHU07_12605, partial [Acidocella sp.]|nr:hypothetical protein [Acidocella sp.]